MGWSTRVSLSDAAIGRVIGARIRAGSTVDTRDSQECDVRGQEYSALEKPALTVIIRVLSVAYDSTEFTPLVLHFINELAPPMPEKRFIRCAFSGAREGEEMFPYLC